MIFFAVRRWKVMTERPTRSGCSSRTQRLDRGAHAVLDEDQVGDHDVVGRIDVPGQRRERAVGHADGQGGHVLERVRHRQEEHVHGLGLAVAWRAGRGRLAPGWYARAQGACQALLGARKACNSLAGSAAPRLSGAALSRAAPTR